MRGLINILPTNIGSFSTTIFGASATVIDTANVIKSAVVNPVVFVISALATATLSSIAFLTINKDKDSSKFFPPSQGSALLGSSRNAFHFLVSTVGGIVPFVVIRISKYAFAFFSSSIVSGARCGLMLSNTFFHSHYIWTHLNPELHLDKNTITDRAKRRQNGDEEQVSGAGPTVVQTSPRKHMATGSSHSRSPKLSTLDDPTD